MGACISYQSDAEEFYRAALVYESKNNMPECMRLLRLACDMNHADALFKTASIYEKENNPACNVYYSKAAIRGNADAQYYIGNMCAAKLDYKQASEWYRKAADQGHSDAKRKLDARTHSGTCVICIERNTCTVCIPCGHVALCLECHTRYNTKICPLCQQATSVFKIYQN
jgi:TPR repeat protein